MNSNKVNYIEHERVSLGSWPAEWGADLELSAQNTHTHLDFETKGNRVWITSYDRGDKSVYCREVKKILDKYGIENPL